MLDSRRGVDLEGTLCGSREQQLQLMAASEVVPRDVLPLVEEREEADLLVEEPGSASSSIGKLSSNPQGKNRTCGFGFEHEAVSRRRVEHAGLEQGLR